MADINKLNWDKTKWGNIKLSQHNLSKMKDTLDSKGCGFCLAKWTQVTMHLGTGLTHSCHHPSPHKIPLEELKNNPSALHNTNHKKEQRKQMLNGERPAECDYCWRIEDNKTNSFSDRVYKSMDAFSFNDYDQIVDLTGDENIYPRYVEVSFSNVCNFKCAYCGPNFSSKWAEEINKSGPYKLDKMLFNGGKDVVTQVKNKEDNPYTEAFWKWFPTAQQHMHTFRITGGEPLLSKHTFTVIEYLIANPNPDLEFAINTNAGVPDKVWKRFVDLIKKLEDNKAVKRFTLYSSAEATGKQTEYIRDGMDWNQFVNNIEYFLNNTIDTRVTFMSAFNLLSAPTFKNFLEYVLKLKKQYNTCDIQYWIKDETIVNLEKFNSISTLRETPPTKKSFARIGIDTPYVRSPEFLDARILTKQVLEDYLIPCLDFMVENPVYIGWNDNLAFDQAEIEKLKRIILDLIIHVRYDDSKDVQLNRKRFYQFVREYETRRGYNFEETFPELVEFLQVCKEAAND
jgi:organic radical activating enzyme